MKHPWNTTILLILLFICAQLIGLILISMEGSIENTASGRSLNFGSTAIGERPNFTGYQSFLYLLFGVLIGTILLLILARFRRFGLWKIWFAFAVFIALSVAFGVFLPAAIAMLLAALLALLKVFKPNPLIHNITEVFLYAGIAVLLVPIFDVFWMVIVLLAISVYDVIAVFKTKHMVTLAEFQKGSNVFAGLMLSKPPVNTKKTITPNEKMIHLPQVPKPGSHAILGGGDVAFPLLFSGVVMKWLIVGGPIHEFFSWSGISPMDKVPALLLSLIITFFVAASLFMLFYYAKKDRYYPAMPIVTLGCFVGFTVMLLFL